MTNAVTYQCPNCDGVLSFNAESGQLECTSCGTAFIEGEIDQAIPTNATAEAQKAPHVKTVDQFLDNAPWAIEDEGTSAALTAVRYACPSCGAEIVADQSTVSTSCPYCDNNMFVAGIATADNMPQWILPFSITREQADQLMRRHFKRKWYLSRKFSASLEHMQAVYVPYHLYDVKVDGWADYVAYDTTNGGKNKVFYAFKRAGNASFERIPLDGSSKMPDAHMDAIAPFSFSEMRPFSPGYAAGYLMEVADESAAKLQGRAEKLARTTFVQGMKDDVTSEPHVAGIQRVVEHETNVNTSAIQSCVLPVWLMHCTWESEEMLFAVNGETGKCVGDLPISTVRRRATVITLVIAMAVAAFFVMSGLTNNWHDVEGLELLFGFAIAVVALVPMGIDSYFKKQMLTAVEATDAGMSYDSDGLVITERWRSSKHYGSESKAINELKKQNALLAQ